MIYSAFDSQVSWSSAGTATLKPAEPHFDRVLTEASATATICPFCNGRHFEICQAELRQLLGRT